MAGVYRSLQFITENVYLVLVLLVLVSGGVLVLLLTCPRTASTADGRDYVIRRPFFFRLKTALEQKNRPLRVGGEK